MTDYKTNKTVLEMRSIAEMLVPNTFPLVDFKDEREIMILKQRVIVVDGYDVLVCLSKADYGQYFVESLQVQPSFTPFLPFALVCKLGRLFFGNQHLSYIEFFRDNHKVYCWTIRSKDGGILPPDKDTTPVCYEGFDYSVLQPGSVDLY